MTAAELYRRLSRVNLVDLTAEAMEAHEKEIVDLNRQQMREGKNRLNESIRPPYAASTVIKKQKKGQEWRFVTLQDTGAFQRQMFLTTTNTTYQTGSFDEKTAKLIGQYGEDIFGLDQENKNETWSIVHDDVVRGIKQKTRLP